MFYHFYPLQGHKYQLLLYKLLYYYCLFIFNICYILYIYIFNINSPFIYKYIIFYASIYLPLYCYPTAVGCGRSANTVV